MPTWSPWVPLLPLPWFSTASSLHACLERYLLSTTSSQCSWSAWVPACAWYSRASMRLQMTTMYAYITIVNYYSHSLICIWVCKVSSCTFLQLHSPYSRLKWATKSLKLWINSQKWLRTGGDDTRYRAPSLRKTYALWWYFRGCGECQGARTSQLK